LQLISSRVALFYMSAKLHQSYADNCLLMLVINSYRRGFKATTEGFPHQDRLVIGKRF